MSNDKFFIFQMVIYYIVALIDERRDVVDYIYLAKTTTQSQFVLITYIVKSTKNQKGKPNEIGLPLSKNEITNIPDFQRSFKHRFCRFRFKWGVLPSNTSFSKF